MKEGQIVIVIDTGNYKVSYAEKTPFKAELYLITDYPCYWVRSLVTGKEYELYESQILECLSIEETTTQPLLIADVGKSLAPHRCPVCNGNGLVPNGFYMQTSGHWSTSSITPETCRSCNGTGIVWG